MTGEGNKNCMHTDKRSLRGGDIEIVGSGSGHASDIETKVSSTEAPMEKESYGNNINGDDVNIVDVDKWASSLSKILEDVPHYMCNPGHPGRLSQIPDNLREVDMKAYEPYIMSIGPYHHGKARLQETEQRKWFALKCFLHFKPELTLKDYLKEVVSIESMARSFYSDIDMDSQQFVQMLLLDSMFLLPLFCGMPGRRMNLRNARIGSSMDNNDMNDRVDPINEGMGSVDYNVDTQMVASEDELNEEPMCELRTADGMRWFWSLFPQDLFLLENQLPFFVLQKIHTLAYGDSETQLIDIMKDKIGLLLADYVKLDSEMVISPDLEVHHLLHVCHLFFRPKLQNEPISFQMNESSHMFRLGSAVQLYEGGVTFEARSGSTQYSLLDITFDSSGKMIMPCLQVDDRINSLLRNLIAFEQMKYPSMGLHVSAYVVLLLHLITTPEDVQLLRRKEIIQHHLGSDKEMMSFVNRLSLGLSFDYVEDNYCLKPLFHELKRYTDRRKPRWKAWLKHRYFNNPWMTISLLAASLLLFMSAVQTYYTVYSYYHP